MIEDHEQLMLLFRLKRYITIKTTPNNLPRLNLLEHGYIFIDRTEHTFPWNNSFTRLDNRKNAKINNVYRKYIYPNYYNAVLYMRNKYELVVFTDYYMLYSDGDKVCDKQFLYGKIRNIYNYYYETELEIKRWEFRRDKLVKIRHMKGNQLNSTHRFVNHNIAKNKIVVNYERKCKKIDETYDVRISYNINETEIKLSHRGRFDWFDIVIVYRNNKIIKYNINVTRKYYINTT